MIEARKEDSLLEETEFDYDGLFNKYSKDIFTTKTQADMYELFDKI